MKIIEKDVEFLKSNNLIDYSMLIGIEIINYESEKSTSQKDSV